MALVYDPKDAANALPEGDYDAVLASVESKESKSGNQMEVWTFDIYPPEGATKKVKEYVTAKAAFKIRDLAKALGQSDLFKAGKFQAEDYIDSKLKLELIVEESPEYGDQNRIKKYLPPATSKARPSTPATSSKAKPKSDPNDPRIDHDSIPF